MKILVGKTFGIGNAVLSIPMIKALSSLGEVDLLIGCTTDDFGAVEVFSYLKPNIIKEIWINQIPFGFRETYDVAVMAIPFDGRWRNGAHFNAKEVVDGRKRPGNVERLGFDMWEKHEVEYQMENARVLGFTGKTPDCSFLPEQTEVDDDLVYIGVGYKRDPGGFGASKHFGNERYAELIREIRSIRPGTKFCSTGGPSDLIMSGYQIIRYLQNDGSYAFRTFGLQESFRSLLECKAYIGNDTGMMHVAASTGMPTCGLFAYPDLVTKNPPFCDKSKSIVFGKDFPSVRYVAEEFVDFVWGNR